MISNTIYISTKRSSYIKKRFDTTFPNDLRSIISQQDFQNSIGRINRANSIDKRTLMMINIFTFVLFLATTTIIAGNSMSDFREGWKVSLAGISLAIVAFLTFFTILIMAHRRSTLAIEQVVAEESMKYSTRKSMPCTWKLNMSNHCLGIYSWNTKIVICIGQSCTTENKC